jgi:hypothetical protein
MEQVIQDQDAERARQIKGVVSTLKSLADATEGNPRGALERLAARHIAGQLRANQPQVVKQAARGKDALALASAAERHFGAGWVDLDPNILAEAGYTPDEVTRLMVVKYVLYDARPFTEWHHFVACAVALNGRTVTFDVLQDLTTAEVAWAMDAMRLIDLLTPFSDEVRVYIAGIAKQEGLVMMPHALAHCSQELEAMLSSVGRALAGQLRIRLGHPARAERHPRTEAETVQLSRLAAINDYVNDRHARLSRELRNIKG